MSIFGKGSIARHRIFYGFERLQEVVERFQVVVGHSAERLPGHGRIGKNCSLTETFDKIEPLKNLYQLKL